MLTPGAFVFVTAVTSNPAGDSARFTVSDTTLAAFFWLKGLRKLQVSGAVRSGLVTITGTFAGASASVVVRVVGPPPPPPPPPPLGALIQVNTGQTFQTWSGGQSASNDYWLDCSVPGAYVRYRNEVHDRVVNELGISRLTTALRTGSENTTDYYGQFRAGTIPLSGWTSQWHWPVNDNADPFTTDSSKFHFQLLVQV